MEYPDLAVVHPRSHFGNRNALLDKIKSCGNQKDLTQARKLHADILLQGFFPKDVCISNALLSMYSRCGAIDEAEDVFDQFQFKDVVSWNTMINGYAQHQFGDKSLECLTRMQDEGISPNAVSFISVLKACGSIGSLEFGERIHAKVGRHANIVLNNALVHMYAKCGELGKAQEVFNELPEHDIVSWNAIITGYVHHGLEKEALRCFRRMQAEGFSPDAVTFICMLKACSSMQWLEIGEEIHAEVGKQRLIERKMELGNALIDMYAKCGILAKALKVFQTLPVQDVVSWNALITGYVQHGFNEEAISCYWKMQDKGLSPNAVTMICVLKSCGNTKCIYMGEEIHTQVIKQGLLGKDIVLGTTLIDMYAKCGVMRKAQEVFDELPVQNIESWNALIGGYAQHGLVDEALRCYRQMRDDGVSAEAITFVCILKACSSVGYRKVGEEIYAEIKNLRLLEKDIILGNAIVDMYAKCGMLEKAQAVFRELPTHDVVTWSSLIAGYAQHGLGDEAMRCYKMMRDEGVLPDIITFTCILRACTTSGSLKMGEEIHDTVKKVGLLDNNIILGNALIDMYMTFGMMEKAHEVFDDLVVRDVVSWTTLIAGYVQHRHNDEALNCFRKMKDEGISPNAVTLVTVLKVCGKIGLLELGEEIHADIQNQKLLDKNICLGASLVDMYAKCCVIQKAQSVFDKLPLRDVVSWNALIAGYLQNGLGQEALRRYWQMQDEGMNPDVVTCICILKACSITGSLKIGEELHAKVNDQGLVEKDVVLGTAFLDMYAKCGELRKAQEVFDGLSERNVISWNALIAGYAHHNKGDEALKCYWKMHDEGVSPDAVTFICILKLCGNLEDIEMGEDIFTEVNKHRLLEKDVALGTALVNMFISCGLLIKAREIFDILPIKSLECWNALVTVYAEQGIIDEALICYKRMQLEGLCPDATTFMHIFKACGNIGSFEMGEDMHSEVCKWGLLKQNVALGTAAVDMFAKCGVMEKAQQVFDELPERNLATWTALMNAHAQLGEAKIVLHLFSEMMEQGITPDLITFLVLLTACNHAGLIEEGKLVFMTMDSLCLSPSLDHYTCFVDLLSRAGQFYNAILEIKKVPSSDCHPLWLTLLGNCYKWMNVELGKCAFEQSLQLNRNHVAAYICMRNLYVLSGNHGKMKSNGKIETKRILDARFI